MASHKGWDRHYPVKTVAKSGGTFNLAKGQLALVDLSAQPIPTGLKIVSNIANKNKDNKYQIRLGKTEVFNNRSQSSKDWSTETFKVTDILGLKVNVPTEGIKTDEFILGYNGFDADSAITLEPGDNEEIGLTLSGEVIGAIGYQDATVEIKTYLTAAANGSTTNQEIVETAVQHLKNYQLYGNIPLSNYVDIQAINSENDSVDTDGVASAFYSITVEDRGDESALAAVQAQYNSLRVVRSNFEAGESTYTVIATPSEGPEVATALVAGQEYEIASAGTTDFTAIGAADSAVGTRFVATGAGTGTGTAIAILVPDFTKFKNIKIKGCEACPAGYEALDAGFLYTFTLEDEGEDEADTIEALGADPVDGSSVKVSQEAGKGTYTVVFTTDLTEAEKAAAYASDATLTLEFVGEVAAVCSPEASTSTVWVEGDSCYARTVEYSIILKDDDCGDDKLAELQAAYKGLTIEVDSTSQCQTKYITNVTTNLVCEECDDAYQDLFTAEAPDAFGVHHWKRDPKTYSETALMGIRFKAKEIILAGSEEYRDEMPNFATSARIAVSGGVYRNVNETFNVGTNGRFAGRVLEVASEPENWGLNLRQYEDITRRYEEGTSRHEGNNYAKYVLGEESLLEPTQAYIDYVLTVRIEKMAQSLGGILIETFNYHFLVAPGAHADVEEVLNVLAAKAGVDTVQALGKA